MIGIIDYGAGNLHSVMNALNYLKIRHRLIKDFEDFTGINKIILPGVGAFGAAVQRLKSNGLYEAICDWIKSGRSYLGICLGLQLLFESSREAKGIKGFGILNGRIKKFRAYKIPQIGWNSVKILRSSPLIEVGEQDLFFYFLHSYYPVVSSNKLIIGVTEYGINYPSIINQGNIYAVQFHPEKSGKTGLRLLKNWAGRC